MEHRLGYLESIFTLGGLHITIACIILAIFIPNEYLIVRISILPTWLLGIWLNQLSINHIISKANKLRRKEQTGGYDTIDE